MNEDIEIVKENVRLFLKILKPTAKTVLYSIFLLQLLLFMLVCAVWSLVEVGPTDYGINPDTPDICAFFVFLLGAFNYELAIVFLRRHHKVLGIFHLLLGTFCVITFSLSWLNL